MNSIKVVKTQEDKKCNERRERIYAPFIDSSALTNDDECNKQ
jgi:hypothetical protein